MNRDDIIRMAMEADVWVAGLEPYQSRLEHFAALVAAAEREACLTIVTDILAEYRADIIWQDGFDHNFRHPIQAITTAFKERGEK